ncbi:stage II sporulation protein P [Anaerostipes sp.]|uniref:stage II sporulation protein P n=1 Tax=Anaerostipes sp. TaxID=1872530 RepID=UPI0025C2F2E0|nr:stage II sporulation protein P [Anaerostipes sp.]MBS7009794.1 stage II sporulation protein P [Anaerostipes sp.]
MGKKKRAAGCVLFAVFMIMGIRYIAGHQDVMSIAVQNYYLKAVNELVPSYHSSGQPIYGSVLNKIITTYRNDIVPSICFSENYSQVKSSDLVTNQFYDLEENEQSGVHVEEVPVKKTVFNSKKWNNPNYLRKYIYQVDSTTMVTNSEINGKVLLNKDLSLKKSREPQILIFHTHGSEAYRDSRKGEKSDTVIGAGDVLTKLLEDQYGIKVVHDRGIYDVKNGKEDRSKAYYYAAAAVEKYLKKYPSIQVVIDLHRDGVKESTKLVTKQNGVEMAQFMFFNGISRTAKNGDIKYLKNPNKKTNLAFSLQLQAEAMKKYPGLTRKIYIKGYRYNLHYRGRSLLIELGAQNNTVKQAKNAMKPLAEILNDVLFP